MKLEKLHIIFFLFVLSISFSFAQDGKVKGYRFDGDEIVFTFDKRDYTKITDEKNQKRMDFADFDIKSVVVSGNFNLWSRDNWKMTKVNENIYELRKKISDFNDEYKWEFKFVINNNFWAEPSEDFANITPATQKSGKPLYTYNLKMVDAYPSKNGNKLFFLEGYKNASKVVLAGSFNKWDEQDFEMKKVENGWEIRLQLRPNTYQYKFIVDGEWIHDPGNPYKVRNEYHGFNSLFVIKANVDFKLKGYDDAKDIILSGSFNDWSRDEYKMKKTNEGWVYTLLLERGKHHYKFIVDGEWVLDPFNSVREYDNYGNINCVRMVR